MRRTKRRKRLVMAAKYEIITLDQMESVLKPRQFKQVIAENTFEYVYQRELDRNGVWYSVRIYTSVDKSTNRGRSVGKDAIRIIVLNQKGYTVSREMRVNRSKGWEIRLNARIDRWTDGIVWCPQCGNPLKNKTGKFGVFMGCSTYPACGYTQKVIV